MAKSMIYAWEDHYLGIFPADTYTAEPRVGVTFCIALDHHDIQVSLVDSNVISAKSFVIERSVPMSITTKGPAVFINYFPLSLECFSLIEFVGGDGLKVVSPRFKPSESWVQKMLSNTIDEAELQQAMLDLVLSIEGYKPTNKVLDMRVLHTIKRIRDTLPETHPIEQYAKEIQLSKDRLSHLFKENTGYNIKAYTLFEKARKALFAMVSGSSFTDAGIEAGFTDAAHFANTVKKFYGLTLSDISAGMEIQLYKSS